MYRYILMTLIGLMGLTPAAMAQEVTATGNYRGQDFALSRRVEILRAALNATVQQVQKITLCNAKGMVYVSGTAAGVDADGCKIVGGTADCLRVFRWNTDSYKCSLVTDSAQCNKDMAESYTPSQVPAGYVNMGVFEDHTYTRHTGSGRDNSGSGDTHYLGYYIDAYCKVNAKKRGE